MTRIAVVFRVFAIVLLVLAKVFTAQAQVAPLAGTRPSVANAPPPCVRTSGGAGTCEQHAATFSTAQQSDGTGQRSLIFHDLQTYGPSVNFGNQGGWTITHVIEAPHITFGTSGIDQYDYANIVKNGVGDLAGLYFYVYGGGRAAASDEGVTGLTVENGEINGYFHGILTGGAGPGSTTVTLSQSKAAHNWGATCDGCMLLDISKGTVAGHLNGPSTHFGSTYLMQLPTTAVNGAGHLPLSQAWCTTAALLPFSSVAGTSTSHTIECMLGQIGSRSPAFTPGLITIAGPAYPEQAMITNAGQPSGGHQTLTLASRNPHDAGSILFQGGIAGQSLSFDDNLASSGFRTSYYVFGSVDGVNLIYGSQIAGTVETHALPRLRQEAETLTSGFHLYPSAEIVANTATPSAPQLEPNNVNWQIGDTVENPRFQSFGGFGIRDLCQVFTPSDQGTASGCMMMQLQGPGISGTYHPFRMVNQNPARLYRGAGGLIDPPIAFLLEGNYADIFAIDRGPLPTGTGRNAVISVNHTAAGDLAPFNLFSLPSTQPGAATVGYDPASLLISFPEGVVTRSLGFTQNCVAKTSPANCGSSSSGSLMIVAGSSTVRIGDGAVTADSQILLTPDASLDARLGVTCNKDPRMALLPVGIVERIPHGGFVVATTQPVTGGPNCYSFVIIN